MKKAIDVLLLLAVVCGGVPTAGAVVSKQHV